MMTTFVLPRGLGPGGSREQLPAASWTSRLGREWQFLPGKFLLGHDGTSTSVGNLLGLRDDRHIFTFAGTRSGKTKSLVIPNVVRYPGPQIIMDPKGEIAAATRDALEAAGHRVFILNAMPGENEGGITDSHSFNVFDEFRRMPVESIPTAAASFAEGAIPLTKDPHWAIGARNLVTFAILYSLACDAEVTSLPALRRFLAQERELVRAWKRAARTMAFDGRLTNLANTFLSKAHSDGDSFGQRADELRSIHSTALEHTRMLDDFARISRRSDFTFADLYDPRPFTLFIIIPGLKLKSHAVYPRAIINLLLAALERRRIVVDPGAGKFPLRIVLEEMFVLGRMEALESAAGYIAGFGAQIHGILQDINQLRTNYEKSAETFLANAGIMNVFAVNDMATADYFSKMLGTRMVGEREPQPITRGAMMSGQLGYSKSRIKAPLIDAFELRHYFSRETEHQIVIRPGLPPTFMRRLPI